MRHIGLIMLALASPACVQDPEDEGPGPVALGPGPVSADIDLVASSIIAFPDPPDGAVVSVSIAYSCDPLLIGPYRLTVGGSWGTPAVGVTGDLACRAGRLHRVVRLGGGAYARGYVTAHLWGQNQLTGESSEVDAGWALLEDL